MQLLQQLKDANFQEHLSHQYYLNLLIAKDQFDWAVYDWTNNTYLLLESYSLEHETFLSPLQVVEKLFEQHPVLKLDYKFVNLIYQTEAATLLPNNSFETSEVYELLNYITPVDATKDQVCIEPLKFVEASTLFAVDKAVYNFLSGRYPCKHKHYSTVLINSLMQQYQMIPTPQVFVQVHAQQIDLVVLNQSQFMFYSSFKIQKVDDILYYIASVINRLELDQELLSISLLGFIEAHPELETYCNVLYNRVSLILRNEFFEYSSVFMHLPSYHYYNLFSGKSANN
jgi:hypothetical protein